MFTIPLALLSAMLNPEFFPTPAAVIQRMLDPFFNPAPTGDEEQSSDRYRRYNPAAAALRKKGIGWHLESTWSWVPSPAPERTEYTT